MLATFLQCADCNLVGIALLNKVQCVGEVGAEFFNQQGQIGIEGVVGGGIQHQCATRHATPAEGHCSAGMQTKALGLFVPGRCQAFGLKMIDDDQSVFTDAAGRRPQAFGHVGVKTDRDLVKVGFGDAGTGAHQNTVGARIDQSDPGQHDVRIQFRGQFAELPVDAGRISGPGNQIVGSRQVGEECLTALEFQAGFNQIRNVAHEGQNILAILGARGTDLDAHTLAIAALPL